LEKPPGIRGAVPPANGIAHLGENKEQNFVQVENNLANSLHELPTRQLLKLTCACDSNTSY
jgi:hypothetical protein